MQFDRKTIRRRRNFLLSLVAVVLAAGALAYAVDWWLFGRFWVVTDNAFVTGNLIPVFADATGLVAQVLFEETENVKKGDLLIRLDEQRARAALGQAEGELGRAVRAVGALFATRQ
ncbi:MAG: biotin/lipoyl-binding protein, partial [Beijerinckiaceae bacterium]|nr:biotin/lipoyl-binding protein [Beijerinckiaceae bacterium]